MKSLATPISLVLASLLLAGDLDILAARSDLSTGKLFIPAMGNCQLNQGWIIDSLPVGSYYWSVQAVDNGYLGCDWAPGQSFTITIVNADFEAGTVCHDTATSFTDLSYTPADPVTLTSTNSQGSDTVTIMVEVRSMPLFPLIVSENHLVNLQIRPSRITLPLIIE